MENLQTVSEKGRVVSADSWLAARMRLLEKERELTRLSDLVNDERRALPRVRVEKDYVFEGMAGDAGLEGNGRLEGDRRIEGDRRLQGDKGMAGNGKLQGDERMAGNGKLQGDERMAGYGRLEGVEGMAGSGGRGRKVRLADLFEGRQYLIIQHFMFGPDWAEGCRGCSFGADASAGLRMHLEHHGYSFAAVSRAPIEKIEAFRKRMGWHFTWVSSFDSDFNFDFHVSFSKEELASGQAYYNYAMRKMTIDELPGVSLFERDADGQVYLVYSGYGREADDLIPSLTLELRDRTTAGPVFDLGEWVRHHDKYAGAAAGGCCHEEKSEGRL